MAKAWAAVGLALVAVATAACDTTQPVGTGTQNAMLTIEASTVSAPEVFVYENWLDLLPLPPGGPDGIPDTPVTVFYDPDGPGPDPGGQVQRYSCALDPSGFSATTSAPWRWAGEIRVLRAGTTEPEVIVSTFENEASQFTSLTDYDMSVTDPDAAPNAPSALPSGNLHFLNGKIFPLGSRFYVERCLRIPIGQPVPEPNVLGQSGSYSFNLNPGDSVIIDMIKEPNARALVLGLPSPAIQGALVIDGRRVPVSGTTTTGTADAGKASFSFTTN